MTRTTRSSDPPPPNFNRFILVLPHHRTTSSPTQSVSLQRQVARLSNYQRISLEKNSIHFTPSSCRQISGTSPINGRPFPGGGGRDKLQSIVTSPLCLVNTTCCFPVLMLTLLRHSPVYAVSHEPPIYKLQAPTNKSRHAGRGRDDPGVKKVKTADTDF